MDNIEVGEIVSLIKDGKTYNQISETLQEMYPDVRGFSLNSVKRFCTKNNLSTRMSEGVIKEAVKNAVNEVGPTYGRKMMSGFLRQKHKTNFGEVRVGKALAAVAPRNHNRRRNNTARLLNPIPYRADYFGHKLHMDQNEKLVMYGVTHVASIDGHSRFVVAVKTMAVKNNGIIYEAIYRKACVNYGMFHQVRVDGGREFYLTLAMQEQHQNLRSRNDIPSYRQTQSRKNLPIERFWVEVNSRVNYPLKAALVILDNNNSIDMENEAHRFCVSHVTRKVAEIGLANVSRSWNEHHIPGRGIPSTVKDNTNRLIPVPGNELPSVAEAVAMYVNTYNGRLQEESVFGIDPLSEYQNLQVQREEEFFRLFNLQQVLGDCVNERPRSFQQAILSFIEITGRLYTSI